MVQYYSLVCSATPALDCFIMFGSVQSKLPVTTASVEQSFSKLKLIKTQLRNRCGEGRLSDLLLLPIKGTSRLIITRSLTFTNSWLKDGFSFDSCFLTSLTRQLKTANSQNVSSSMFLQQMCLRNKHLKRYTFPVFYYRDVCKIKSTVLFLCKNVFSSLSKVYLRPQLSNLVNPSSFSFISSFKLLNIILHKARTVGFVHHLHWKHIKNGTSNGQYEQDEWLQWAGPLSVFTWTPDCIFKKDLKICEPVL